MLPDRIPTQVIPDVQCEDLTTRQVAREFRELVGQGTRLRIAGTAKQQPQQLLIPKLKAQYKIRLFETTFYLTDVFQFPELRFFVAFVVQQKSGKPWIYPRVFYKDLSLAWRSASHFSFVGEDFWIGKGDVRYDVNDGYETIESDESTTDLPLEMQAAVEGILEKSKARSADAALIRMILREAPASRIKPYRDFTGPRELAASHPANLIYKGKKVARFRRPGDPDSLWIAKGFEPDFDAGRISHSNSTSKLYGGKLDRFRFLSANGKIQYLFLAGPRHTWIIPPQALTTELSSYGVRTISVHCDDDLLIPGFEYHYHEQTRNGVQLYSQIPEGFAGPQCELDDAKADASPWLDRLWIIQEFRSKILATQSTSAIL